MLERELTGSDGVIQKELDGTGWTWDRIPDTPNKHRSTVGYDGLLMTKNGIGIRVEVKIGYADLTPKELDKKIECLENGQLYAVLRLFYMLNHRYWVIELSETIHHADNMQGVVEWLELNNVKSFGFMGYHDVDEYYKD